MRHQSVTVISLMYLRLSPLQNPVKQSKMWFVVSRPLEMLRRLADPLRSTAMSFWGPSQAVARAQRDLGRRRRSLGGEAVAVEAEAAHGQEGAADQPEAVMEQET